MPTLIRELTGGTLSEAAQYGGWMLFAFAGMQFLFSPVLGQPQRPVRPAAGAAVCPIRLWARLPLSGLSTYGWGLFVGRVIAGITGASFTTAAAYIADYSLGGIATPALQGIMSGQVAANEQGELQGALTSLVSATSIVGPPLMTNQFSYFTSTQAPVHFPGAAFHRRRTDGGEHGIGHALPGPLRSPDPIEFGGACAAKSRRGVV